MASPATPEAEQTAVTKLIHDMYGAWTPGAGRKTWAGFARHANVSEYSLTEWRSGRGAPSAPNLLLLLDSVGWLHKEGQQTQPVDAAPRMMQEALDNQRLMRDSLDALSKKVVAISTSMTNALKLLESLAEDGQAQSKPTKRRAG